MVDQGETQFYTRSEWLPDNFGHEYPPEPKVVLTCLPTANSNSDLTVEILQKVIFPNIGILEGKEEVFLWTTSTATALNLSKVIIHLS